MSALLNGRSHANAFLPTNQVRCPWRAPSVTPGSSAAIAAASPGETTSADLTQGEHRADDDRDRGEERDPEPEADGRFDPEDAGRRGDLAALAVEVEDLVTRDHQREGTREQREEPSGLADHDPEQDRGRDAADQRERTLGGVDPRLLHGDEAGVRANPGEQRAADECDGTSEDEDLRRHRVLAHVVDCALRPARAVEGPGRPRGSARGHRNRLRVPAGRPFGGGRWTGGGWERGDGRRRCAQGWRRGVSRRRGRWP